MVKSKTKLYKVWSEMKRRCNNPNDNVYEYYGGRGISYCAEWEKFVPFEEWAYKNGYKDDVRGKYTLDRIDVNGNYCPENCRWISQKEQGRNKRDSVILTINNESKTMKEWSEISGIPYATIQARFFKYGYTPEEAVFTPVRYPIKDGIVFNGTRLSAAEWSRRTGIKKTTIEQRIKRGWSVKDALTTRTLNPSECRAGIRRSD